jgi:excisionase family DNA binding protein
MQNDIDSSAQPTLWGEVPQPRAPGAGSPGDVRRHKAAPEVSELWTIDEVADYLDVPKQTVYCWRTRGYGPAGFRVGKHLRWRASTVIAWTVELEHQK